MSAPPGHPPVSPTGPHVPSRPTAPRPDRPAHPARQTRPSRSAPPGAKPPIASRWVTAAYAASVLGLSKMSVYRLIHTGKLAHTTLDGAFRIPLSALEEHMSGKHSPFDDGSG